MTAKNTKAPPSFSTKSGPGIYKQGPFDEYLAHPAVNASLLKVFDESPRHARAYLHKEDEESGPRPHLVFGSYLHSLILEPGKVKDLYGTGKPSAARNTKEGCIDYILWMQKEIGLTDCPTREFLSSDTIKVLREDIASLEDSLTKEYITGEEVLKAQYMRAQVLETVYGDFVNQAHDTELTVLAEIGGVLCKIRCDMYSHLGAIIDIKSTRNSCRKEVFSRDIAQFRYDIQAGLYTAVAKEAGLDVSVFAFVPVMKEPPHLAAFLAIEDLPLLEEYARFKVAELKACQEAQEWVGYYTDTESVSIPSWRRVHMEEQLLQERVGEV